MMWQKVILQLAFSMFVVIPSDLATFILKKISFSHLYPEENNKCYAVVAFNWFAIRGGTHEQLVIPQVTPTRVDDESRAMKN